MPSMWDRVRAAWRKKSKPRHLIQDPQNKEVACGDDEPVVSPPVFQAPGPIQVPTGVDPGQFPPTNAFGVPATDPSHVRNSSIPAITVDEYLGQSGGGNQPSSLPRLLAPEPSNSRSSQETSPQSEGAEEDAKWDDIFPREVFCSLYITLDDRPLETHDRIPIDWIDKEAFEILDNAARKCLKDLEDTDLRWTDFYLRNGSCKIVGRKSQEAPHRLEHGEEIVEVLVRGICGFIHDHPYEPFHVEIYWDYATFGIPKVDDTKYQNVVQKAIRLKMKRNYKGQAYVPRTDLIKILSPDTTQQIIEEDETIPAGDKAAFAEDVKNHAQRLQALCVYTELPMLCLKNLMEEKFSDQNRPTGPHCCPKADRHFWDIKFENLLRDQWSFFPYKFPKPDKECPPHDKIDTNIVVPILFKAKDDAHGKSDVIGEGAFSIVYKARIDPVHHQFTAHKNEVFALKKFHDRGGNEKFFQKERTMLQELARFPHTHIVTHLMTWTQGEKFYMLFPLAVCNLRGYMENYPSLPHSINAETRFHMPYDLPYRRPLLDSDFVSWFLEQLVGLGEAVEHIHTLKGEAVKGSPARQLDPQSPPRHSHSEARNSYSQKRRYGTGFHHDIKPENILVFDDGMGAYGTIKISDFGSGKFQMLRSGSRGQVQSEFESRTAGTYTYEGPDMFLTGRTSRPYDMWSFGCVILEMLLWIFDTVLKEGPGFATERAQTRSEEPDTSDDQFWYTDKGNRERKASLKPAVQNKLKLLEDEYCQGKRAFQEIIPLLKSLFIIDAKNRMTATELASALRAIKKQAKRDLERDPECYRKPPNYEWPAESVNPIPRSLTTVRSISRAPSRTGLNDAAASPDRLNPQPYHRRYSQSSTHEPTEATVMNAIPAELPKLETDLADDESLVAAANARSSDQGARLLILGGAAVPKENYEAPTFLSPTTPH